MFLFWLALGAVVLLCLGAYGLAQILPIRSWVLAEIKSAFSTPAESAEKSLFKPHLDLKTLQTMSPGAAAASIQQQFQQATQAYVQQVRDLRVDIEPFSLDRIRNGKIDHVRLRASRGIVGDFQRSPLGVPFENLDFTLDRLVVDQKKMLAGSKHAWQAGRLQIRSCRVRDTALNQILAQSRGMEKNIRVAFKDQELQLLWLGKIHWEAALAVQVLPSGGKSGLKHIFVSCRHAHVHNFPIPNFLVNWFLQAYNPLILGDERLAEFELGTITLENGILAVGTNER